MICAAVAALAAGVLVVAPVAGRVGRAIAGPAVIHAGWGPWALAVTPDGRTLFVADYGRYDGDWPHNGHTVTPVDVATGRVGAAIRVGNEPLDMAVTPNGRTLYVLAGDGTLTPVDVASRQPGRPIRFASHLDPGELVVAPDGQTLYVVGSVLTSISTATGRRGVSIPSGGWGLVITPDGRTIYVADAGEVTPVDVATGRPGAAIRVRGGASYGPYALAMSPDGRTVYIGTDDPVLGSIAMPLDVATGREGRPIPLPASPAAMAVSPDGRTLYAAMPDAGTIAQVSIATRTPGAPIRVAPIYLQAYPTALAITPDGRMLYAVDQNDGRVAAIPLRA